LRQPFKLPDIDVGTFQDMLDTHQFQEQVRDGLPPILGTGAEELDHQHIPIKVHDQARETIRFGVDQAEGTLG
jgi:hypothetical protein